MSSAPPFVAPSSPNMHAALAKPSPPGLRFIESFTWMFESPKWFLNLLQVALLANLLPILGQIAAMGYFFSTMDDLLRRPRFGYADVDLGRFVEYLKLGWRPWVVQFVASMIGVGFALVCYLPLFISAVSLLNTRDEMWSLIGGLLFGLAYIVYLALLVLVSVAPIPLIFRVGLTGDLRDALKFRWALSYLRILAPELFLMTLLLILTTLPLMILGTLACFFGTWFVAGWFYFAAFRLLLQLYELFLARGGEPIPLPAAPESAAPLGVSPPAM